MDYRLDLLMNPRKVNKKKYHILNPTNIHEHIQEHIINNLDIIDKPLDVETLSKIISLTIQLYDKKVPFIEPIERNIIPPKKEICKQIKINKIEPPMDISKVDLL